MSRVTLSSNRSLEERPTSIALISSLLPADSPRVGGEDPEHVRLLAELEDQTPPIVVHRSTMRVIDGMHRLQAAVQRGQDTIEVRFFDGEERDAFVLAVELNSGHGLPLSQADRTSAAARVVSSHPHWSDRAIASLTGLSAKTVAAIRRRSTEGIPQLNGRVGRDGKVRPLSTARGRQLASQLMSDRPDKSLREIAREAGVSLGTAQDVRKRLNMGQDPVPPPKQRDSQRVHDLSRAPSAGPQNSKKAVKAPPVASTSPDLLQQLKKDPSLRFSDMGRRLLQLLHLSSIPPATWARFAEYIPIHCTGTVARIARDCSNSWSQFADQIELRCNREFQ
ncbi:MAG TPA: ParB N-terminal domain-containing protein [Pseudonocardiaceae bacterium]|nr:ParB N-terminal domain-containing protein [Pseudonocardiaceae bacterium]